MAASRNPDVPAAHHFARLPQRALDAVVDEVERGSTRALPGTANLLGQDEDGRMKGGLFRPARFPAVEHSLPHDAHAGAVVGLLKDAVVLTGLATVAKLQVLSEKPLLEDIFLEFHPLPEPLVDRPAYFHELRSDEAVE